MNTKAKWMWLMAAGAALSGCGGNSDASNNYMPMNRKNVTPEAVNTATKSLTVGKAAKVREGSTDFGFKLFKQIATEDPAQNVFVSPVSAAMALGMAYNGSAGTTKSAFEKVLGIENTLPNEVNQAYKDMRTALVGADPKVEIQIANAIWTDRSIEFKRDFLGRNTDSYGAKIQAVPMQDPETLTAINNWVSDETEKKIPKLFDSLDPNTVAVLVNAIYFKGLWTDPFKKEATKDQDFTGYDGKKKSIAMMNRSGDFDYLKEAKFSAIQIPYGDGRVRMVVFLPNEGQKVGAFIKDLNDKNWSTWLGKFKPKEGSVTIPKWKMDFEAGLNAPLKELGLGIAFEPGKADFTAMAEPGKEKLYITRALQKSFIDVNEEGTEAAAATGVEMAVTSAPVPTERFTFVADRPFVYAIFDKTTGMILFMGVQGKP